MIATLIPAAAIASKGAAISPGTAILRMRGATLTMRLAISIGS